MSIWSLSLTIIIIITSIWDTTVVYYHHHPPPITQTFPRVNPQATPRSQLLWVHYHTPSSSSLAYFMSTLFGNHWRISPQSIYSTFGPLTCVSGYRHAQNDLLLLSHVYSMSQILLVVYSSHTSLYYPSFESQLSSSNLFPVKLSYTSPKWTTQTDSDHKASASAYVLHLLTTHSASI